MSTIKCKKLHNTNFYIPVKKGYNQHIDTNAMVPSKQQF